MIEIDIRIVGIIRVDRDEIKMKDKGRRRIIRREDG